MAKKNTRAISYRYSGDIPRCPDYCGYGRKYMGIADNNNAHRNSFKWQVENVDGATITVQKTSNGDRICYIYVPLSVGGFARLIAQVFKNALADIKFYVLTPLDHANAISNEPVTSPNGIQESDLSSSRTWTDTKSGTQLTTLFVDLEPINFPVYGITASIEVMIEGKVIASKNRISYSRDDDSIFNRAVSPAFFIIVKEDGVDVTKLAIITVTHEYTLEEETEIKISISRWIADYDSSGNISSSFNVEQRVDTISLNSSARFQVTLNQDATNAAVMIGLQGYKITSIKDEVFAPTIEQVTFIEEAPLAYYQQPETGHRERTVDFRIEYAARCDSYYANNQCQSCSTLGHVSHTTTSTLEAKDRTQHYLQKPIDGSSIETDGTLLGFGYDIMEDIFNMFIYRKSFLAKDNKKQIETIGEAEATLGFEWNDTHDRATFENYNYAINSYYMDEYDVVSNTIEFHTVDDLSVNVNPTRGGVIVCTGKKGMKYREDTTVISFPCHDGNGDPCSGGTPAPADSETYEDFEVRVNYLDIIDVSTGMILVKKENRDYEYAVYHETTETSVVDAKGNANYIVNITPSATYERIPAFTPDDDGGSLDPRWYTLYSTSRGDIEASRLVCADYHECGPSCVPSTATRGSVGNFDEEITMPDLHRQQQTLKWNLT